MRSLTPTSSRPRSMRVRSACDVRHPAFPTPTRGCAAPSRKRSRSSSAKTPAYLDSPLFCHRRLRIANIRGAPTACQSGTAARDGPSGGRQQRRPEQCSPRWTRAGRQEGSSLRSCVLPPHRQPSAAARPRNMLRGSPRPRSPATRPEGEHLG